MRTSTGAKVVICPDCTRPSTWARRLIPRGRGPRRSATAGRLPGLVVVPDHRGQGEEALQDPDRDPDRGMAAVAFQVQPAPGRSGSPLRAGPNNRRPQNQREWLAQ